MVLHRLGRTLAVDCDPQGSLMSWSEAAADEGNPLPFTVVGMATRDVHVPLAEHFAGAFGSVPAIAGEYWELLAELKK